ncbi:ABC transporter permease [Dyadobacter chenwenxiniae]|uniref:ABC transporter permease n=1 Tax=Dyadobacter chenwenxiniae TaxID=2906456 RepID=A0A9X1PIM0_9BACT|nr:ABC transporter permease [Dyadobacter chenwenxiniae]MCF0061025.1 ABC transporter permease [Dyadobacter chenwenxiniae]UON80853.1 ABC transporter permease [Dyadobacter chenwenxiniae]
MIQNYLKIAWRSLLKNKVYSAINVFGLAIGITTCMLITLYVMDEISYDKHQVHGERIYRVASQVQGEKWVAAPGPMAAGLKRDFPEVEQVTRLLRMPGIDKFLLKNETGEKQFYETNGYYVDSTFFQIFTYDFKYGDQKTALNQPNSIIITEEIASKLFGNVNPVDKIIKVNLPFAVGSYTVKGVLRNNDHKSHIPANMLLSMNNSDVGQWAKGQTNWATNNIFHTYLKLNADNNADAVEGKLDAFLKRNGAADLNVMQFSKKLFLQPLRDIYLYSNFDFEIAPNGNVKYLYIFSSVAAFLLLIACINFMNLSTARSEKRAKEVGVKKVVGAAKSSLVGQFLWESLLLSTLALLISLPFLELLLPTFNQLTGKNLYLLQHPEILGYLFALTIVTGLLAGFYPAFYLSSFSPIATLKGRFKSNNSAVFVRKGLVVFQFTVSIVLILGAMLISQQMEYLSNQNLGFNKGQKVILPLQTTEAGKNYKAFKNELANIPQVKASAVGSTYPGIENVLDMLFYAEGKTMKENVDVSFANIDNDYIKTLGIKLLQGRGFSNAFSADSNALVLNEVAVKKLGYNIGNAVGKKIYSDFHDRKITMTIIGVVKDYHFESLQHEIKPLALTVSPFFSSTNTYLIVDVHGGNYGALMGKIGDAWKKVNPGSPFEYSFLDSDFQKNYEKEERTSRLIRYFSLIGIVIACLGLFGLATFTAEQRTREIGIRKVLGASVLGITGLLSADFLKLVFISIVIATPISSWAMNKWLENFAFKTVVSWQIFVVAGIAAILVAFVTISFQSIKAALTDPVKTLKSE